jgi:hypothetical protein
MVSSLDERWLQRFRPSPDPAPAPPPAAAVPVAEPDAAARVTLRLRYEKTLAGSSIQVAAIEGGLELKGKVKDARQKKRAVELAESTTGVDRVTVSLEVDEQSPRAAGRAGVSDSAKDAAAHGNPALAAEPDKR